MTPGQISRSFPKAEKEMAKKESVVGKWLDVGEVGSPGSHT